MKSKSLAGYFFRKIRDLDNGEFCKKCGEWCTQTTQGYCSDCLEQEGLAPITEEVINYRARTRSVVPDRVEWVEINGKLVEHKYYSIKSKKSGRSRTKGPIYAGDLLKEAS